MSLLFLQPLNDKQCSRNNMIEKSLFIDYKASNNHVLLGINQKNCLLPINFFLLTRESILQHIFVRIFFLFFSPYPEHFNKMKIEIKSYILYAYFNLRVPEKLSRFPQNFFQNQLIPLICIVHNASATKV